MNYLISYKIFEYNQDISKDIKDILVELEDDGFSCKVIDREMNREKSGNYIIMIERKSKIQTGSTSYFIKTEKFQFGEVKDVLLRIYQYMRELGFKSELSTNYAEIVKPSKNFIIRPDDKFRYLDGSWIDDNHEVSNIRLYFHVDKV